MDDFLIKLLLLIVPAVFTVLVIVLSPILEAQKIKNKLVGLPITVMIYNMNDEQIYHTEGQIDKIQNGILVIKRRTQPSFKIPFVPENFVQSLKSKHNTPCISVHYVNSEKDLDPNKGLLNI